MATVSQPSTSLVLSEEVNGKGVLTLNRPKALNAVNYEMVATVHALLSQWQNTKSLILVKGAGEKAFCAGGDVRSIVEAGDTSVGRKFFRTEYATNYIIGTLNIPYVAVIDGITMGGGVGMSVHGKYRVATEKTLFAMPETAIGLFPDVGGSYFLPRLTGKLGLYLALTGARLKGKDVLAVGVATHYCESAKIPQVERALLELKHPDDAGKLLDQLCPVESASEFSLAKHLNQINQCFSAPTIEGILTNLEKDGSDWAQKTIQVGFIVLQTDYFDRLIHWFYFFQTLRTVSPTSLKITQRQLDIGAKSSLAQCLQMEFRLAYNILEDSDFSEGEIWRYSHHGTL